MIKHMRRPTNLLDNVLASLYLFLGGLPCPVIHPVCRLQVINESSAKTGSHVFYLKKNDNKNQQKVESDLLPLKT